MLSVIPVVITDITETGSAVIDWLGALSIAFYDLVTGAGSSLDSLSVVASSDLTSSK